MSLQELQVARSLIRIAFSSSSPTRTGQAAGRFAELCSVDLFCCFFSQITDLGEETAAAGSCLESLDPTAPSHDVSLTGRAARPRTQHRYAEASRVSHAALAQFMAWHAALPKKRCAATAQVMSRMQAQCSPYRSPMQPIPVSGMRGAFFASMAPWPAGGIGSRRFGTWRSGRPGRAQTQAAMRSPCRRCCSRCGGGVNHATPGTQRKRLRRPGAEGRAPGGQPRITSTRPKGAVPTTRTGRHQAIDSVAAAGRGRRPGRALPFSPLDPAETGGLSWNAAGAEARRAAVDAPPRPLRRRRRPCVARSRAVLAAAGGRAAISRSPVRCLRSNSAACARVLPAGK